MTRNVHVSKYCIREGCVYELQRRRIIRASVKFRIYQPVQRVGHEAPLIWTGREQSDGGVLKLHTDSQLTTVADSVENQSAHSQRRCRDGSLGAAAWRWRYRRGHKPPHARGCAYHRAQIAISSQNEASFSRRKQVAMPSCIASSG